jgi:hypothetical protein
MLPEGVERLRAADHRGSWWTPWHARQFVTAAAIARQSLVRRLGARAPRAHENGYGKSKHGELLDEPDSEANAWWWKTWMTIRNDVRERDDSGKAQKPAAPRIVFDGEQCDQPESANRAVCTGDERAASCGQNECGKADLREPQFIVTAPRSDPDEHRERGGEHPRQRICCPRWNWDAEFAQLHHQSEHGEVHGCQTKKVSRVNPDPELVPVRESRQHVRKERVERRRVTTQIDTPVTMIAPMPVHMRAHHRRRASSTSTRIAGKAFASARTASVMPPAAARPDSIATSVSMLSAKAAS